MFFTDKLTNEGSKRGNNPPQFIWEKLRWG